MNVSVFLFLLSFFAEFLWSFLFAAAVGSVVPWDTTSIYGSNTEVKVRYLDGARCLTLSSDTEYSLLDAVVHVREPRRPDFRLNQVLQFDSQGLQVIYATASSTERIQKATWFTYPCESPESCRLR